MLLVAVISRPARRYGPDGTVLGLVDKQIFMYEARRLEGAAADLPPEQIHESRVLVLTDESLPFKMFYDAEADFIARYVPPLANIPPSETDVRD